LTFKIKVPNFVLTKGQKAPTKNKKEQAMTFNNQSEFDAFFPNSPFEFDTFPVHADLAEQEDRNGFVYDTEGTPTIFEKGCTYRIYDVNRMFVLAVIVRGWIITDGDWTLDQHGAWFHNEENSGKYPMYFKTDAEAVKYGNDYLQDAIEVCLHCF